MGISGHFPQLFTPNNTVLHSQKPAPQRRLLPVVRHVAAAGARLSRCSEQAGAYRSTAEGWSSLLGEGQPQRGALQTQDHADQVDDAGEA